MAEVKKIERGAIPITALVRNIQFRLGPYLEISRRASSSQRMCSKLLFFISMQIILFPSFSFAYSESLYAITLDEHANPVIRNAWQCNSNITNGGGDFSKLGIRLRGKCEGAGISPGIFEEPSGKKFLYFSVDPAYVGVGSTRSELALTQHWFPFKKPVYIGFKLKIPDGTSVTRKFFYLMQFWQCAPNSPIAGIRMERGTSHRINFMTRGDNREGSVAEYELEPDKWYSFIIKVSADPTGKQGELTIWDSPRSLPIKFNGAFGYAKKPCNGLNDVPQRFRLKFGMYKGAEPGENYAVGYDDIRIGDSFESASPWEFKSSY